MFDNILPLIPKPRDQRTRKQSYFDHHFSKHMRRELHSPVIPTKTWHCGERGTYHCGRSLCSLFRELKSMVRQGHLFLSKEQIVLKVLNIERMLCPGLIGGHSFETSRFYFFKSTISAALMAIICMYTTMYSLHMISEVVGKTPLTMHH